MAIKLTAYYAEEEEEEEKIRERENNEISYSFLSLDNDH